MSGQAQNAEEAAVRLREGPQLVELTPAQPLVPLNPVNVTNNILVAQDKYLGVHLDSYISLLESLHCVW